jgi:hypothetical protein
MSTTADAGGRPATDAELRAALEDSLGGRVVRIERRPSACRTSFLVEELDVWLDDGRVLPILFKDLGRHALTEGAQRAKPSFLYDPLREIETYRRILAPAGLGPVCYGASVDERAGRYWLFLERVAGKELYLVGDLAAWEEAARWLAGMHARSAGTAAGLTRAAPLLVHDADYCRRWLSRARAFLGGSARVRAPARRAFEWLAERYDEVVDRLTGLPATFLHGEFYASNVLVRETAGRTRVCPVDWEMAAVGPGLMDLAALVAGRWTEAQRETLVRAYRSGMPDGAEPPGPWRTLLDHCRLQVAVQWLGWAQDWSPPPEHAQDWLGEALSLAEKLLS